MTDETEKEIRLHMSFWYLSGVVASVWIRCLVTSHIRIPIKEVVVIAVLCALFETGIPIPYQLRYD